VKKDSATSCLGIESCAWKLYIDGAARNNPGPAGAGIFLTSCNQVIIRRGFYLGSTTNNQAEYMALILGLFYSLACFSINDKVCIISDSLLLVKQMRGEYKIRNPELLILSKIANSLLQGYNITFIHVLREFNKEADELANIGIDNHVTLPKEFLTFMRDYDIRF